MLCLLPGIWGVAFYGEGLETGNGYFCSGLSTLEESIRMKKRISLLLFFASSATIRCFAHFGWRRKWWCVRMLDWLIDWLMLSSCDVKYLITWSASNSDRHAWRGCVLFAGEDRVFPLYNILAEIFRMELSAFEIKIDLRSYVFIIAFRFSTAFLLDCLRSPFPYPIYIYFGHSCSHHCVPCKLIPASLAGRAYPINFTRYTAPLMG